ncbi:hypothetical protein TNCV_70131 [Trichonephila clavipes]|nr:hypothetical protein TNCV_70131 [Trichonephila clavipes]
MVQITRSVAKALMQLNTTRGFLTTDFVILNHGQVTRTTPELAPRSPNYHTTPTGGRVSLPYTKGIQRHEAQTHDAPATRLQLSHHESVTLRDRLR